MNRGKRPETIRARACARQPIRVRRSAPFDRPAIAAMYRSFAPKGACLGLPPRVDPEAWLEQLAGCVNLIAELEGQVVGHAVLCPTGQSGEIALFVHQDQRDLGVGRLLLSALMEEARTLGLSQIWGTTEHDNVPMLRLAASVGFAPGDGEEEFFLNLAHSNHAAQVNSSAA